MPNLAGRMWLMWPEGWKARYDILLDTAKRLRDDDHHEAAIVTAQTACEVCAEAMLSTAFQAKGIEYLSDPLAKLISSYNLANKRVRNVYVAVSGDRIHEEPFWASFVEHVERRNAVVHRGREATRQEAEDSIVAAEAVIRHLLCQHP